MNCLPHEMWSLIFSEKYKNKKDGRCSKKYKENKRTSAAVVMSTFKSYYFCEMQNLSHNIIILSSKRTAYDAATW